MELTAIQLYYNQSPRLACEEKVPAVSDVAFIYVRHGSRLAGDCSGLITISASKSSRVTLDQSIGRIDR